MTVTHCTGGNKLINGETGSGPKTSGAILIIGAGIAGMEAALNCVEAGFKVYLADRKPNIGGNMAQLDKIFPTNDCSMCVMAPKLVEVGKNPNIELLMNSEVFRLEGGPGHFQSDLADPAKAGDFPTVHVVHLMRGSVPARSRQCVQ